MKLKSENITDQLWCKYIFNDEVVKDIEVDSSSKHTDRIRIGINMGIGFDGYILYYKNGDKSIPFERINKNQHVYFSFEKDCISVFKVNLNEIMTKLIQPKTFSHKIDLLPSEKSLLNDLFMRYNR